VAAVGFVLGAACIVAGSCWVSHSVQNTSETTGASSSRVEPGSNMDKANRDQTGAQPREPINANNVLPTTKDH